MTIVYSKQNILKFQTDAKSAGYYLGAIDGIWGPKSEAAFIAYMKEKTYDGATFPYDDYKTVTVKLNPSMVTEYNPARERALQGHTKGIKLLATVMAHIEGFYYKSRSYKTRNPGNIGNTDSGGDKTFPTLEEGIKAQAEYITRVATGNHPAYPLGKDKLMPPYYSKEIERNRKTYGIPAQLPGYHFVYTGQLNQFTKIYSTGARVLNSYSNQVISYFAQHGITLTPESTLAEIVA